MHEVTDLDDLDAQLAAAGDKLVAVDFHASWCGPCKMIGPYFVELADEFKDVVFLKVDVDVAEDVASKFDVESIPKFIFFKNKEKVADMLGPNREKLKGLITQHK